MADTERESRWRDLAMAGDRQAWRALYDAAFDGLAAYVQWRCGGLRGWADDVVQETWLVAVRRLGDFRPGETSFLNWLRGIAANVIRNQLRTLRRSPLTLVAQNDLDQAGEASPADAIAEEVARALAELPAHYEAVLRAKYFDGLRVEQIAEETASTAKAVESLLSRARAALREAYERRHAIENAGRPGSEP